MALRTVLLPVLVVAAVLAACSAAALLAVPDQAGAAFPGQNGRIAFDGDRASGSAGSVSEVITVSPDGTGTRQLTSGSGSGGPTFSPDGTQIAYSGSGIHVMDRFGNGKRALTDNDLPEYGPAWSPDGSKIAFVRQERVTAPDGQFVDWQVDIWVMNADGSGQRKLTDDFAIEAGPTWSPNGTKIAFGKSTDIWTMAPDGSRQRNLTNTPNTGETDPDFSPDGKKLAFASNRQYKKYDVYTMNLDATALTNVTDSPYLNEEDCVWSPSGTKIAYRRDLSGNPEIYTKNADGSGRPKNVSNDPGYNESPDWGPKPTTTVAP